MASEPGLLFSSTVLMVPRRANLAVRSILNRGGHDGDVIPITDDTGTLLAEVRPLSRSMIRSVAAGVVSTMLTLGTGGARRKPPDLAVSDEHGSLQLRILWSSTEALSVVKPAGDEIGSIHNEGSSSTQAVVRL